MQNDDDNDDWDMVLVDQQTIEHWQFVTQELGLVEQEDLPPSLVNDDGTLLSCVACFHPNTDCSTLCNVCGLALTPNPCLDRDRELAQQLGRLEEGLATGLDAKLAAALQASKNLSSLSLSSSRTETKESILFRAKAFLEKVEAMVGSRHASTNATTKFGLVDLGVQPTADFIDCHTEFEAAGKHPRVSVAYHCVSDITRVGRCTVAGLANNPFAFHQPNHVGVMVAVLVGNVSTVQPQQSLWSDPSVDTLVFSNQDGTGLGPSGGCGDAMMIVRESVQCLPLLFFPSQTLSLTNDSSPGNQDVWTRHLRLQGILDDFFNKTPTPVDRTFPSSLSASRNACRASLDGSISWEEII